MKLRSLALGFGLAAVFAWFGASFAAPTQPSPEIVARGKYPVDQVAMCGECHSQHDQTGQLIRQTYLKGSALAFKPILPLPVWRTRRPTS